MLKREFEINVKSLGIWTGIMVLFFLVVFSIYPSIMTKESMGAMDQLMQMFPEGMLKVFNMDIVSLESAFGWFQTEGYTFLSLMGAVYAAILGGTILVKEENDKTIEFLCSKPITRKNIVSAKMGCGILNIAIFTGVVTIFNYIGLSISQEVPMSSFLLISLAPLLLYYMVFFICLLLSTFLRKTKPGMSLGLAVTFISYLMQIIGGMGEKVEWIKKISLFEFSSARYILENNQLNIPYLAIGIAIIILCVMGIYLNYQKKEFV